MAYCRLVSGPASEILLANSRVVSPCAQLLRLLCHHFTHVDECDQNMQNGWQSRRQAYIEENGLVYIPDLYAFTPPLSLPILGTCSR